MPKSPVTRLTAKSTLAHLAKHSLLDSLTGSELVVYVRLVAAVGEQRTKRVKILNAALHGDARTAGRALRKLEDHGLIRVHDDGSRFHRTIEVD